MSALKKFRLGAENPDHDRLIPPASPDGSGIGVNYADAYLRDLNVELEGGLKVSCKRKGLKVLLEIGGQKGEGLMRRLEHGPEVKVILRRALAEAAAAAGARFSVEGGAMYLELRPQEPA
jgi:hypothetical protein